MRTADNSTISPSTPDARAEAARSDSRLDGRGVVERILSDRPSFHLGGEANWSATSDTLTAISELARPGEVTIETGAGASTVVFAASGAAHTAISPDPTEHELVRDYCRRIGIDDSALSFHDGLSDDVLPALLGRERTLSAAFIDGAHSFPFPEVDWHYISRSLKVGGALILDDIIIPSVTEVFRHMRLEPHWRLERILDERAALFTLIAEPPPELWTNQRHNSGYPDFSFAPPAQRLRMSAAFAAASARRSAGARFPALRRAYRRVRGR